MVQAYVGEIYAKFGGSVKILSVNGTELKSQLFTEVTTQLEVECKVYSSPYHLQSNRRIEVFCNIHKACVSELLEWDEAVPLASVAYILLPKEYSKKSPFFFIFGRHPIMPSNFS